MSIRENQVAAEAIREEQKEEMVINYESVVSSKRNSIMGPSNSIFLTQEPEPSSYGTTAAASLPKQLAAIAKEPALEDS